jgi:DNA helicase HerA-like ATPase
MRADSTHRIGTVAAVESERVSIEIDPEATGLVKAGTAGILPIGAVNSYVVIAAGSALVVAVVTAIRMIPTGTPASVGQYNAATAVTRTIEAVMVGRLDGGRFESGITAYPSVFAPVYAATRQDLEVVFRPSGHAIRLGEAVVAADQDIWLDADKLLGHHFAVLGTTGAGKSCSVVATIDALFDLDLPSANIVIFDTNGEYAPCFAEGTNRGGRVRAFTLGPEPGADSGFVLPQWFMNTEEHLELVRAAEGVQAPLMQRAVADARIASQHSGEDLRRLRVVRRTIQTIEFIERNEKKIQEKLAGQFSALEECLLQFLGAPGALGANWTEMLAKLRASVPTLGLSVSSWDPLTATQQNTFENLTTGIRGSIRGAISAMGLGSATAAQDFDAPAYYSMEDLSEIFLPQRIDLESAVDPRIGSFAVTMQMRLSRLLADDRYSFVTRVTPFDDALALYLRLLLGVEPSRVVDKEPPWKAAYESTGQDSHSVTIIDLSLVAQDVLPVVTGLLARLLIDLAQRIQPRASIPILVVLEEAHRYVRRDGAAGRSQSSLVFERIAKEGRKFGVSLGIASQRPSELDPTVLSQCGTLIAHRIVGQVDQDIIRAATPLASRDLLRQLPGLATQHAVVLGDAVPAPALVRIRHVDEPPDSKDPSFIDAWSESPSEMVGDLIDRTAREWENGRRRRSTMADDAAGVNDGEAIATPEDDVPF